VREAILKYQRRTSLAFIQFNIFCAATSKRCYCYAKTKIDVYPITTKKIKTKKGFTRNPVSTPLRHLLKVTIY